MATVTDVRDFWEQASCGEDALLVGNTKQSFDQQARERYRLEPYIETFAQFANYANKDVLEIGVGLGADHQRFAEARAKLKGIDLTERAINHTRHRLSLFGLHSDLQVANAEALPFADEAMDLVYSWGVIHHSPNTEKIVEEIYRVLRPGGQAKVMIYNYHSLVGFMLWLRYALGKAKPLTSLTEIYSRYLESPGTKAYTPTQAKTLFRNFKDVATKVHLTHGDLLSSHAGQRHNGIVLDIARKVWPRKTLERFAGELGLFLTVTATK